ncbi:MAG: C39 family peptidase [Bacteroidetes bacterium]|nr:C39 family peptidase [Bacteroidota bacterium]
MRSTTTRKTVRVLTRGIAPLLIAGLLAAASAAAQQPSIMQIRPGVWAAGIPTEEFEYFAAPETAGHQRQSNWCWAACVQMVLNYHGIPVTQEQVVERIFGGAAPNVAGQPDQILEALTGWAVTRDGQKVRVSSSSFAFDGSEIVRDLAERSPIVVGVRTSQATGHAYVLTAVTYTVNRANEPIFLTAILRDPWPNNQSRIEVPWSTFQRNWMFMARVRVEPM